jgi:hypothetical protein
MTRIPIDPPLAKNMSSVEISDDDAVKALWKLGLSNTGAVPDDKTSLGDVFLYALTPMGGARPDHGIALGVASELEALAMFIEGPLSIALEMMARRVRTSVALAQRMRRAEPPPPPEAA